MRVKITRTRLVICSLPWGLWILSTVLVFIALISFVTVFQINSLVCGRYNTKEFQSTCKLSHFTVLGANSNDFLLSNLKEARIQELHTKKSTSYKVVLVTTDKILELEKYGDSNNQGKQEIVSRINAFRQNTELLNLSITDYPDLFLVVICLLWNIFVWGFFFYGCQITTCTFDKTLGTLNIKRQSLLGTKVMEYFLYQITSVTVLQTRSRSFLIEPVFLHFASGKPISVYRDVNLIGIWKKEANKIANLIHKFLDLRW